MKPALSLRDGSDKIYNLQKEQNLQLQKQVAEYEKSLQLLNDQYKECLQAKEAECIQLQETKCSLEKVNDEKGVLLMERSSTLEKLAKSEESLQEIRAKSSGDQMAMKDLIDKLESVKVQVYVVERANKQLKAERDRYRELCLKAAEENIQKEGYNLQAKYPQQPEIDGLITHTLEDTVSDWVIDCTETNLLGYLSPDRTQLLLPQLLVQVFRHCWNRVSGLHQRYVAVFAGLSEPTGHMVHIPDEATEYFMLQHMRRYYKSLYLLDVPDCDAEINEVISKLGAGMEAEYKLEATEVKSGLVKSGLAKVILEYFHIIAAITLHPKIALADDWGQQQLFDPKVHAPSIDGDGLDKGHQCIVVFPALLKDVEGGNQGEPPSKKFVLPVPPQGGNQGELLNKNDALPVPPHGGG